MTKFHSRRLFGKVQKVQNRLAEVISVCKEDVIFVNSKGYVSSLKSVGYVSLDVAVIRLSNGYGISLLLCAEGCHDYDVFVYGYGINIVKSDSYAFAVHGKGRKLIALDCGCGNSNLFALQYAFFINYDRAVLLAYNRIRYRRI